MFILTDLIPLRNVGIEVTLAVKLTEVRNNSIDRRTDTEHMPHRFPIDDRERPGVCHTDRTDIYIWPRLVRVVPGVAEHLGPRLQFCMNFQTYRGAIHICPQYAVGG